MVVAESSKRLMLALAGASLTSSISSSEPRVTPMAFPARSSGVLTFTEGAPKTPEKIIA
ncbi:hypothetical protein D3C85_1599480 [compost metagenome]